MGPKILPAISCPCLVQQFDTRVWDCFLPFTSLAAHGTIWSYLSHALRSTGHKKAKIFGEASSSNPPTATQRKRHHSSSDEAQFESHPRPTHWEWKGEEDEEGVHYLLPLKSKRGLVQQPAIYRPSGTMYLKWLLSFQTNVHSLFQQLFHVEYCHVGLAPRPVCGLGT